MVQEKEPAVSLESCPGWGQQNGGRQKLVIPWEITCLAETKERKDEKKLKKSWKKTERQKREKEQRRDKRKGKKNK